MVSMTWLGIVSIQEQNPISVSIYAEDIMVSLRYLYGFHSLLTGDASAT